MLALFGDVARLRGLAPTKDVAPRVLDEASFARAVEMATREPVPPAMRVLHEAFGFPLARPFSASTARRYVGLYDFRTHELVARRQPYLHRRLPRSALARRCRRLSARELRSGHSSRHDGAHASKRAAPAEFVVAHDVPLIRSA
jgi:hypothetical protein